jgi:ferric-dicitrate binding protein FerR (iron transport regulator)
MISFAPEAGGGTPGRDAELVPTLSVASDAGDQIEEKEEEEEEEASDDGDENAHKGARSPASKQDSETDQPRLTKTLSPAQKAAIAAFTVRSQDPIASNKIDISRDYACCTGKQAQTTLDDGHTCVNARVAVTEF